MPECEGFYFVRHGQTTANRDGIRSGGERDPELTPLGQAQILDVASAMKRHRIRPGLIITSPLSRTVETSRILGKSLDLDITVNPALNERRLGDWNDRSVKETQPLFAQGLTPPGGESNAEFRSRILDAFNELASAYGQWPLIVSSSGVARILREHAGFAGMDPLQNGAVLKVTLSRVFEISELQALHQPPPE